MFRYDGAGVRRFDRSDGLPGELIDSIVPAPDGSLWVRARNGIARLMQERFEPLALPPGTAAVRQVFQSFAVDSRGTLFITTTKGLLRFTANGGQTRYGAENGIPEQIDAVVRDADDTIWFAGGGQLFKFTPAAAKPEFVTRLGVGNESVIALLPAPGGKIWIRTSNRVGTLQTQNVVPTPVWLKGPLPIANNLGGPTLDQGGNMLLPTYQGLYRWLGNGWELIDHHNGLTSSALFSALEDREGGIWVGTAGAGLDHWPGSRQWSGWTDSEGLPDPLVLGVVRDHRSRLWLATNTALVLWNPETRTWRAWTQNGLANSGVGQVLLAQDGAVWALTGKGLFRFDASAIQPRAEHAPGMPAHIAAAPDGSIWAASKNSLSVIRYRGGAFPGAIGARPQ